MSDIESAESCCVQLKKRLLPKLSNGGRKSESVSSSDVSNTALSFAVTINIQPTKFMNKRQWKLYDHDQQRRILARVELASRKKTPSIILKELHYEKCPKLGNIHFHALYTMPPEFMSQLEAYYARVVAATGEQINPFRYMDVQQVYDEQGWLQYIRKSAS